MLERRAGWRHIPDAGDAPLNGRIGERRIPRFQRTVRDMLAESANVPNDPRGWRELVSRLHACGFSEADYLARHDDLRRAGFDPPAALDHFLRCGHGEDRFIPCGPFPNGLQDLVDAGLSNPHYARGLFRSVCIGQLQHANTAGRLWRGVGARTIAMVREQGGVPYFAIGDSHTAHYFLDTWIGERWLAPLIMVCPGATAGGLANFGAKSQAGLDILRWAQTEAKHLDVPIILKFGGIDTEFAWIWHMIRNDLRRSSMAAFEPSCRDALARYGRFLDMLTDIAGPRHLWICSVFPAILRDNAWVAGFLRAHALTPDRDKRLADSLARLEIPSLAERTGMRGYFNHGLRALCAVKSVRFIDDFAPFVGAKGVVDARFLGAHGGADHHLDVSASRDILVSIVEKATNGQARGLAPR
jgi:hypothetical protein